MKIDVDKLVNELALSDCHELDADEEAILEHLIALARVGAAAVELRKIRNRKPHYDRPIAERVKHDGEDLRAYHELTELSSAYLTAHPEGAPQ